MLITSYFVFVSLLSVSSFNYTWSLINAKGIKGHSEKIIYFLHSPSVYRANDLVEGLYTPRAEHTLR